MTVSMKSIELEVAETVMDNSVAAVVVAGIMVDIGVVTATEAVTEVIGAAGVVVLEVAELLVPVDPMKRKLLQSGLDVASTATRPSFCKAL